MHLFICKCQRKYSVKNTYHYRLTIIKRSYFNSFFDNKDSSGKCKDRYGTGQMTYAQIKIMQVHTGKRHELCYAQHRKDCSLYTYLIRTPDSPFTTADTCTYRPFRADASISHTGDIRPQRLHNKASARIGLHTEDKRFRPDMRYDITVPQRPVCRDIAFTNAIKKLR